MFFSVFINNSSIILFSKYGSDGSVGLVVKDGSVGLVVCHYNQVSLLENEV